MEVLLTGSLAPSQNSFISVSDLHTGSHLLSFKQSSCAKCAVASLPNSLLVAQNDKALINVYKWHKEGVDQKLIIPNKLDTLCSSHDGTWLAGGDAAGKIYLWEVSSGNLLFVKEAHYQGITSISFSQDDLFLVTGAADAVVKVWSTVEVLDPQVNQDLIRPRLNLTQHNLAISALHVGTGSSITARLFTASLDQSIRIWDLATGQLLTTLLTPAAITCMAVDPAERFVYAGTAEGVIHEIRLYKLDNSVQAIGGMGAIFSADQSETTVYSGHESPISALSLSHDGALLISGAEDGNVFIWDVATKQMIRKAKQQPSAVTLLLTTIRPVTAPVVQKNQITQLQPLKRAQAERDRDEHNVYLRLSSSFHQDNAYAPMTDLEAVSIGLGQITNPVVDPAAQETVTKLQEELKKLYGSYSELRVKHEQLNKDFISSQV